MSFVNQIDAAFEEAKNSKEETKTSNEVDNTTEETKESSLTENDQLDATTEEAPIVEDATKEEESQLTEPTAAKEEEPKQPEVDYESYVKENGYISKGDYEAKVSEYEQKIASFESSKVDDPLINTLIERKQKGLPIDVNFLIEQTIDYDSIDTSNMDVAKNVVKKGLINEGYSPEEADLEIEVRYENLTDYEEGDREYDRAVKKLTLDANKTRKTLKEYQQQNRLPESKERQEQQEAQQKREQEIQRWRDDWSQKIPKNVSEYNKLEIKNGEDVIAYDMSEQDKTFIQNELHRKIVEGVDLNYTAKYFDEQNRSWDVNQMIQDEAWGNSDIRGRLLAKALNEVGASKADEAISRVKNTKLEVNSEQKEVSPKETKEKKMNSMAEFLLGRT